MTVDFAGSEFEAILAPIPGENPSGIDVRADYSPSSPYFRLRDARSEARDAERRAETEGGDEGLPILWRPVVALAMETLSKTSKDLEVATWLTEALVRTAGLPGLAQGAALIASLVETFWDGLFPMPDEDGMETRVSAVAGLSGQGYDGTLMQPLRKAPLFMRPDGSPFSLWQFEASLELEGVSDSARRAQRIEAGVVPFAEVEKEARIAGAKFWTAKREEVSRTASAWERMGAALDDKAGSLSPSGNRVRDLLQLMLDTCNRFAPATAAPDPTFATTEDADVGSVSGGAGGAVARRAPGVIVSREQALAQLGELAAWFKRHEPNSPLAYTLEEAVRRGQMSWPELMDELIPDETTRHALLISLGIKPRVPETD